MTVTHRLVPLRILPNVFLGLGDILASQLKVTKRGKRISAGTVLSLQKSFVISLTSVYRSRDLETMNVMMILKLQMKIEHKMLQIQSASNFLQFLVFATPPGRDVCKTNTVNLTPKCC